MSSISLDNAYLLLIAIPIIAVLAVPFIIAVRKDNCNGHNIASFCIHILLAILIAFTAAGTSVIRSVTETDVYVVADCSYSASRNLDTVDNYIENLKGKLPRNSKLGVICFGSDYKLHVPLGGSLKSVKNCEIDDSATNIIQALEYAALLFGDDVIKRIVLITDGAQTDGSDSSALKREVDNLSASGVYVDAIYLDDNLIDGDKEVQITSASFTATAFSGRDESVSVLIESSYTVSATLELYKNGEQYLSRTVSLVAGSNTQSFTLDTSTARDNDYELVVTADGDESSYNNNYKFTQIVSDVVHVLFLTSNKSDTELIDDMYGDAAAVDCYYYNGSAFKLNGSTQDVPYTVEALCYYDEIVLSDIDVREIYNSSEFMSSLDYVVSSLGKSLLTFGNTYIYNTTGEDDDELLTDLQNMLPIKYKTNDSQKRLFYLVIDISLSMYEGSKYPVVQAAAKRLISSLGENDYFGITVFYGEYVTAMTICSATDANKNTAVEYIDSIECRHGTYVSDALEDAYNNINKESGIFGSKQVMLITDGVFAESDRTRASGLVEDAYRSGITTSVIYVQKISSDGSALNTYYSFCQTLATQYGGGSFYYASDATDLQNLVLSDEFADIVIESNITQDSWITITKRYDSVMSGVDTSTRYFVDSFMYGEIKSSATTVLTVSYTYSGTATVDVPLYAYWSYGNGYVSSYSSSLSVGWYEIGVVPSDMDETFFKNVFEEGTPTSKNDYPFTVDLSVSGSSAELEVSPYTLTSAASASVTVTAPDGTEQSQTLAFSVSAYYGAFTLDSVGKYAVAVTYSYGGTDYISRTVYTISYLPEYDAFTVYDAAVLHKAVDSVGTVNEDGSLEIVNNEEDEDTYVLDLTLTLAVIMVSLFLADVVVRKLKWDDIKSLFRHKGRKKQ